MRLLHYRDGYCFSDHDDHPPPYAVLSHTWSEKKDEEVLYCDVLDGTAKDMTKLDFCRDQAAAAGLEYFWIDTCCINECNDAEVAYAIRSMYRWYSNAALCLVYLSDLSMKKRKAGDCDTTSWKETLKNCRWFQRGWTLQELIAPKEVEVFARDGHLGSKEELLSLLCDITGIQLQAPMPNHRTRLGWIANRVTKRPEDRAYCMMGICGVVISPQYGEGEAEARRRLETAIVQRHGTIALEKDDHATGGQDYRQSILDLLKFDAMESRRMTIATALKRTCEWILAHPVCIDWMNAEHSFLWIKGKPGAGKSVMVKFLDERVRGTRKEVVPLSFYFTARGEQLEKTFAGMYRSLLVQLLQADSDLGHILDNIKYSRALDVAQLQSALAEAVRELRAPVCFFIDAVDECQENDVLEMIDFFENLQDGSASISVCFASRHYPIYDIPTRLQLVLEDADEHTADLEQYVRAKLRLGSASTKRRAEITAQIISKANGVFLWVILAVNILQKHRGRLHAVQERLNELPPGLMELFEDILQRDQKNMDDFVLCLRWILYAKRPLQLPEFYFAMMAGLPGQDLEWDPDKVTEIEMQDLITRSSKGFAELTKGKKPTAQFIHESVRDFLLKEDSIRLLCPAFAASPDCVAHEQLKRCCTRGIDFPMPESHDEPDDAPAKPLSENERRSLMTRYPFAEYATTNLMHHANKAAPEFPQQHFLAGFDFLGLTLKLNTFQRHKINMYNNPPSFTYFCAQRNLAELVSPPCNALEAEEQRYRTPLIAAFVSSSMDILRVFLDDLGASNTDEIISEAKRSSAKYESSRQHLLDFPWRWAIRNGLEHLAKHLLISVPVGDLLDQGRGAHALIMAIDGGNIAVVEHLLSIQPSLATTHTTTAARSISPRSSHPVAHAAKLGQDRTAELILHHLDKSVARETLDGALPELSEEGQAKGVKILLAHGASVNAQHDDFGSALQAASCRGHEEVIEVLLAHGADVNVEGGNFGSALQAASRYGLEGVVAVLLANGANVNAKGGSYGSALQAASLDGHERVVEVLLAHGADVNVEGGNFGSALQAASRYGHEEMIEVLLAHGAEVNVEGGNTGSALQAASRYGHKEVVEVLLARGANVNASGRSYGSALQAASRYGHERVVEVLLANGADVNADGGSYGSALQASLLNGYENVVKKLLAAGAKGNTRRGRR